jgi:hypothetical protein
MNARVLRRTCAIGAIAWLAGVSAAANAATVLSRSVMGNGGGVSSGSGRKLTSTAGQTAVGLSTGASNRIYHGYWGSGGYLVLAVDPPGGTVLPTSASLGRVYPNPSHGSVFFELGLPRAGDVRLALYDVAGRHAGEFHMGSVGAGLAQLTWQPPQGLSGIYFARIYVDQVLAGERRVVIAR